MPHANGPAQGYTVRISDRARRVRLLITPREGLLVVVPRSFPASRVPGIVASHAAWIERTLERTADHRAHLAAHADAAVPETVSLPGIGAAWRVVKRPGSGPGVRARLQGEELVLRGDVDDREACFQALRGAVSRAAKARLPLMLGGIEAETGWSATKVTVRRQRTRWGSCSAAHRISLNESLAFLPPHLVRYVLVHELAHTQALDHSSRFWGFVEQHEAGWRAARRELRDAWRHVPTWADPPRTASSDDE